MKETHGFRKFFQTSAITAGMNPLFSELLIGHTSGGLALESYVRPTENDLLEGNDRMLGYIGIIDQLTIAEENKLRRENTILKQRQENKDQILIELQRKFDAMEKRLEYQ